MAENAQHDLDEALPALAEATKALESLNKKDMTEIKSYAKPPALVEKVMEAVMILRGGEPTWAEAKRQLGECILDDTMVYTPFLFLYNSLSIFWVEPAPFLFFGLFPPGNVLTDVLKFQWRKSGNFWATYRSEDRKLVVVLNISHLYT